MKAPEHTIEESMEQLSVYRAKRSQLNRGRPIILVGDCVGGLLTLFVSLRILPRAFSRIVLIYPVLDLQTERESYRTFGEGFFLDSSAMRHVKSILRPFFGERDFAPLSLSAHDLDNLPACSVVTAGFDVLYNEGKAWLQYLSDRGVNADYQHFPDLPHDFCLYVGRLESSRRAVTEIAASNFRTEEKK